MVEFIDEPTRIVGTPRSCIDHIITNVPDNFVRVGTFEKLSDICDHKPIFATLSFLVYKPMAFKRMVWNYNVGAYDNFIYNLLNAPRNACYDRNDVNDTVDNWLHLFL